MEKMKIEKITDEHGIERYIGVTSDSPFERKYFHDVETPCDYDKDYLIALHTNLGSITVLDRMTGFGYRDIETGYTDTDKRFWLASGGYDVTTSGVKTIGEAIEWIKENSNNCKGI